MQLYVLMDAVEPTINPCILTVGLRMVYAPNSSSQVMMKRTPPNTTKFGGVVWLPNLIWVTCNMRQDGLSNLFCFPILFGQTQWLRICPTSSACLTSWTWIWEAGLVGGSLKLWKVFLKQHFKMGPLNCRKQNETNKGKQETVWFFGHIPFWHLGPQVHLA